MSLHTVAKAIAGAVLFNLLVALWLYTWVTDDDLSGLRGDTGGRLVDLLYFTITCFSSLGFGDIMPQSDRAKLFVSGYVLAVYAGAAGLLLGGLVKRG